MERTETDWMSSKTMIMPMAVDPDDASYLTRVEVYQGSNCLVDDEFCKNYISIGRSSKSDIVLPDTRISRNRFYLYIDNYQIFVFVLPNKQPLRINGQPVNAAQLGTDDTIEIGPYTLKIQVRFNDDPPQSAEDLRYQVVFEGQIQNGFTRSQVAKNLKKQLKINGQQTASLFSGKSVVIGQDLDLPKAVQFKNKLEKSGAIGQVQAVINSAGADEKSLNGMSVANLPGENDDLIPKNGKSAAPLSNRTVKNSKARNSVANLPGPSDEKRASAKPEIHGSNPPDEKPKIKHPGTNQPDRTVLKPQDPMADAEIAEQPGKKPKTTSPHPGWTFRVCGCRIPLGRF